MDTPEPPEFHESTERPITRKDETRDRTMRNNTTFSKPIEDKLSEYRKQRKAETGKMPFRATAIEELLRKALDGIEPARPIVDRLDDLERRVAALEYD